MLTTYRKQIDSLLTKGFTHIYTMAGWKQLREIVLEAHDLDPSPLDDVVDVPEPVARFDRETRSTRCGVLGVAIWPVKKETDDGSMLQVR